MRAKVILNPTANHGRASKLADKIIAWGSEYGELEIDQSERIGHATILARQAVDKGFDIVVAAGGDGTAHEVINGLIDRNTAGARLAIIPLGSGNDYAFGLQLSLEPEQAVRNIFEGRPRTLDLARIEDGKGHFEHACNGIGIGFDATVNIQSRTITRVHGFAMYALAALRTIALYYQTPHLKIYFDDLEVEQDALLLAAGLGPRIGGGFYLTPDAHFNDGLLDSCMVNPIPRSTMLRMLPEVMRGSHVTSPHVTMRRSVDITVLSDMPLPIHIDGEIFAYPDDDVREIKIITIPNALEILCPQKNKR